MELVLVRTYHDQGTNGELYTNGRLLCYTIELPWKDNQPRVSCVPEGRYELRRRYSPKFKEHLLIKGVQGRSFILLHPANDALRELMGCIAPVSKLTGTGKGEGSRAALRKVLQMAAGEGAIFLTIKNKKGEHTTKDTGSNAFIF
jgi:hypothetical protein